MPRLENAMQALEDAQINVARAAMELVDSYIGQTADQNSCALVDLEAFNELREACAEWKSASNEFLAAQQAKARRR